jgi:hypothetical protein
MKTVEQDELKTWVKFIMGNLGVREFAEKVGIPYQTVSLILQGKQLSMSQDTAERLGMKIVYGVISDKPHLTPIPPKPKETRRPNGKRTRKPT